MLNFITRLADAITDIIAGPNAPARSRRMVQRAIAIGAFVGSITMLGPIFGYGLMAVVGVLIMLVASPEKKERS